MCSTLTHLWRQTGSKRMATGKLVTILRHIPHYALSTPPYSILFHSILFHSTLLRLLHHQLHSILFHSIPFYSTPPPAPLHSILFYSIPFDSTVAQPPLYSILVAARATGRLPKLQLLYDTPLVVATVSLDTISFIPWIFYICASLFY